jgi:hypothetical protein
LRPAVLSRPRRNFRRVAVRNQSICGAHFALKILAFFLSFREMRDSLIHAFPAENGFIDSTDMTSSARNSELFIQ